MRYLKLTGITLLVWLSSCTNNLHNFQTLHPKLTAAATCLTGQLPAIFSPEKEYPTINSRLVQTIDKRESAILTNCETLKEMIANSDIQYVNVYKNEVLMFASPRFGFGRGSEHVFIYNPKRATINPPLGRNYTLKETYYSAWSVYVRVVSMAD